MTSIASGPPGLEAVHRWNGFPINELGLSPRIKLRRLTGFHSRGEHDDDRAVNTGRRGETPGPATVRGKTIVYEGTVQSRTLDGLRVTATALRHAFGNPDDELTMLLEYAVNWQFAARCIQFDEDDEQLVGLQAVWPFQRDFTAGLRLSDSRMYVVDGMSAGPFAAGSAQAIVNPGLTDSDPTFTVTGVAAGGQVDLINSLIGERVRFTGLPAGTLVVDFKRRTATVAGADVRGKLDVENSGWWFEPNAKGILAGANNLQVTGGGWTVAWHPASE